MSCSYPSCISRDRHGGKQTQIVKVSDDKNALSGRLHTDFAAMDVLAHGLPSVLICVAVVAWVVSKFCSVQRMDWSCTVSFQCTGKRRSFICVLEHSFVFRLAAGISNKLGNYDVSVHLQPRRESIRHKIDRPRRTHEHAFCSEEFRLNLHTFAEVHWTSETVSQRKIRICVSCARRPNLRHYQSSYLKNSSRLYYIKCLKCLFSEYLSTRSNPNHHHEKGSFALAI